MALRNILQEGDPTLTKPSREVTAFDERLHTLLDDMRETLFAANGVGLAAPRWASYVGWPWCWIWGGRVRRKRKNSKSSSSS